MRVVRVYVVEESDTEILNALNEKRPWVASVEIDSEGEVIGYFITDDEFLESIGIEGGELYVPAHLMPYKVYF